MHKPFSKRNLWQEWRGFVLFIAIMLIFRSAIADWNQVPTGSMIPSILAGDRIVVDKMAYDLRLPFTLIRVWHYQDPQRSDVITFESPQDDKLLVKRVIGTPGDVVTLRNNKLSVNEQTAQYAPLIQQSPDHTILPSEIDLYTETVLGESRTIMLHRLNGTYRHQNFGPVEVPADHYLVLGDNRDNSQDYRFIGFVHRNSILGKANAIAFSLDYENYYIPRSERFFRALN